MAGAGIYYITANLLLYIMWINNQLSYRKMSDILGSKMITASFYLIRPRFSLILIIILLSFFTVYISAIMPARKSAKLNIIDGLNGLVEKKIRASSSSIIGKLENSLARDYFQSYKKTYRTILVSMLLSVLVITLVLVYQSYSKIMEKYDTYKSPYNFTAEIFSKMIWERIL